MDCFGIIFSTGRADLKVMEYLPQYSKLASPPLNSKTGFFLIVQHLHMHIFANFNYYYRIYNQLTLT